MAMPTMAKFFLVVLNVPDIHMQDGGGGGGHHHREHKHENQTHPHLIISHIMNV